MASVCGRFDPNKLTQDDDIKEEETNGLELFFLCFGIYLEHLAFRIFRIFIYDTQRRLVT